MRKTRWLSAILVTVFAFILASCAGEQGLRLRPKAGDQAEYHAKTEASFAVSEIKGPPELAEWITNEMPGSFQFEYDAALTFVEVADGRALATYEMTGFQGVIELVGERASLDGLVPDALVTIEVDTTTGEVLSIEGLPELGLEVPAGLDDDALKNIIKQSFAQLPSSGYAKLGDEWEQEGEIPILLPGVENSSRLKTRIKYAANEERAGLRVAKVTEVTDGPIEINLKQENGLSMGIRGNVSGEAVHYFELANGLPLHSEAMVTGKVTQTAGFPELNPALSFDLEMSMTISVDRLSKP